MIALAALFLYAGYEIATTESRRDIVQALLDDPATSTENRFSVVYEVDTQVIILRESITVKLPDQSRLNILASDILSREDGVLACDKNADPDCLDEAGQIVTFRAPLLEGATPDGTTEQQGLLRPIGNAVELPTGELIIVSEEQITARQEDGLLECDRTADSACQDKTGTIITFQQPYRLLTGVVVRDDILIRHDDDYQESVRPNRISNQRREACTREEQPFCSGGQIQVATFRARIIGTETGRENDELIVVRTVDEQVVYIPAERIISRTNGVVECDREANPRCNDFEGTIIERRGEVVVGELTVENNRAVNIIPGGQVTAIEIPKTRIEEETRTPENCRVEDEGTCLISIREADDTLGGTIKNEDSEGGITLQTVAPVFVQVEADQATVLRRSPLTCALNNLRGCNAGIWLTLFVTFVAYGLALMLGLFVGLMRVSSNPILYHASTFYVEVIRGTPLLVLLLFFAFVIGPMMRDSTILPISLFYDAINSLEVSILGEENFLSEAVLGLAVGYGAFLAEVFRAGIESIGRGQMEAARSLGMTYPQAMRKVILPQAIRVVLPPLGNDFIAMLKDSALISVLALPDLLQMGRLYITRTFQPIPVYVIVALLYIAATFLLSMMVRYLERRFRLP
jgi:polar amino acid transport system permease protein